MKDVMIDLETLSTETDAVVLSIGAVMFDIEKIELGKTFYSTLSIQSQLDAGRKISESTLLWWLNQDKGALRSSLENPHNPSEVLEKFSSWLKDNSSPSPWGHGAGFDITIMESMFKTYDFEIPWSYRQPMDLRTFARFVGKGKKIKVEKGVAHNALDDAVAQAQYVIDIVKENKLERSK